MAHRPQILYFEDDKHYIELVRDVLEDCDVQAAQKLGKGMALLRSGKHFDLVLVNMHLTEYNENGGGVVLEYIRDHHPSLPRIVITGAPFRSFGVSRLKRFIEEYQLEEFLTKNDFDSVKLRETARDVLGRKLEVEVKPLHAEIPRLVVHLYQRGKLERYPRLQLFEFVIRGVTSQVGEVIVVFEEQFPYIQKTRHPRSLKAEKTRFFLSPVFTDQVSQASVGTPIAVTDIRVLAGEECIWRSDESFLFHIVDTVPIRLRQAAQGNSWVHSLIAACITPNSPGILALAGEVRSAWSQEHPGEIWRASHYTETDALNVVRHLRDMLKERLVAEGSYIPAVPDRQELVDHAMRLPDEVLKSRGANCLYYSLVYASVLENLGIHPLLLSMTGHVMVGWKKTRSSMSFAFEPDCFESLDENCVFIESTGTSFTHIDFEQMLAAGQRGFRKAQELRVNNQPVYLLDIVQLRSEGLSPYVG